MSFLRLASGFLLVFLGLSYLFYPQMVLRINAFMRENVFNDKIVLLNPRKVGAILVAIGLIFWVLSLRAR